jgi:hypothetical protein
MAEFMMKVFIGENTANDPRVRDKVYSYVVRKYLMNGVMDWDKIEEELESVMLKLRADIKKEEQTKITAEEQ